MADVSELPARLRTWRGRQSRGQLFLVGALALAVLFVTLAFLLNTAIYTENLATRSDGASATDVIEYQHEAQAHGRETMGYVNRHNNTTYTALFANYTGSMDRWNALAVTHRVANGHVTTLTVIDQARGTRIEQDANRNFTDRTHATNWTLVENATVRNFTMEVDRGSLMTTSIGNLLGDTPLYVNFTETDGDTWTVYIYQSSSNLDNVKIAVKNETGATVGTCEATTSRARVAITNRSLGGKDCPALHFFDELDENYHVQYNKAEQVKGTYSLTVDRTMADLDSTHYYSDADGASPYITPGIYSAHFRLVYRGPETYYDDEFRIAPGEPDA